MVLPALAAQETPAALEPAWLPAWIALTVVGAGVIALRRRTAVWRADRERRSASTAPGERVRDRRGGAAPSARAASSPSTARPALDTGVHGLLGPNGAGKTTLIKALATVVRPHDGELELVGNDAEAAISARSAGTRLPAAALRLLPALHGARVRRVPGLAQGDAGRAIPGRSSARWTASGSPTGPTAG